MFFLGFIADGPDNNRGVAKVPQYHLSQGAFGAMSESGVSRYQQKKAQLQEQIEHLGKQLQQIKQQRLQTPHHLLVGELPEAERFPRVLSEQKHFLDTNKPISRRVETSMACVLREALSRDQDARALLRQIYSTDVDLFPDAQNKTLTVLLHHLTQAAHDEAVRHLCDELNVPPCLIGFCETP